MPPPHDLTAHFFHKYCQCLQCGNYYVWIHWSKSWWGVLQAYHQNCLSLKSCKTCYSCIKTSS
jgi:hypothetical protein